MNCALKVGHNIKFNNSNPMKKLLLLSLVAALGMLNSLNVSAQGYYNQNPQYYVWYQTGTVGLAYDSGYGFISDEPWQMGISLGVNTRLVQNLYLGARVGYNGVFVNASGVESESHFLTIPVELGYALTFGEGNFAIIPYAGLTPNIGLAGTTKIDGYGDFEQEIGGKFALETDLGLRIRLGLYTISATAVVPVNDVCESFFGDETYFRVSVGLGF